MGYAMDGKREDLTKLVCRSPGLRMSSWGRGICDLILSEWPSQNSMNATE